MADYEALAPGGHAHLVSDIKSYADRAGGKGTTQLADGAVTRAKLASDVIARLEHMHDMGDTLKGNNFFGTLAEGTVLTADDVYGAPASGVEVYGKSTQVQTTGKNLFNPTTVTLGKYIDANGYLANTLNWDVSDYIEVSGTSICVSGNSTENGVYHAFYDESKTLLSTVGIGTAQPFTIPSNAKYIRVTIYKARTNTAQVELGTTATAYEPYSGCVASPNPDFPQPIKSVDDLTLEIHGINRMYLDASTSGVTETDGVYEGAITDLNNAIRCKYPIPAGSAFTIDVRATATGTGNLNFIAIRADTGGYMYCFSPPNTQTTWATYTCVFTHDVSELFLHHNASGTRVWQFRNLCIRMDGSTAYAPYVGQSITIPLSDNTARSLPDNTRDQFTLSYIKKSATPGYGVFSKVLTQRIDECDMGDLEWEYSTTYHMMHAEVDGMRTAESGTYTLYCTGYKDYNNASVSSLDTNMPDKSIAQRANYAILYVKDNGYTDAELFTTAVTGMKVQYALATPVTHDLGTVELPVLPAPDLTAWCDGGSAQPSMSIGYEQDVNIVIQGLEAAIAELATA